MFPRTSTLLSIIAALCFAGTIAMPLLDEEDVSTGFDNATLEELQTNVNDTPKNL